MYRRIRLSAAIGMLAMALPPSFCPRCSAQQPTASALGNAVRAGDLRQVIQIVAKAPRLINLNNTDGYTPLHWAVQEDELEIARFLLQRRAKVNQRGTSRNVTPLFGARSGTMAELLLKHGADRKLTPQNSTQTPLMEAAANGYFEVVKVLMAAGDRLDFDSAVNLGWKDEVAKLLKAKPRLAKPPRRPLEHAATLGDLDLTKLLLDHRADPNLDAPYGNISGPYTSLTVAVRSDNVEIAKLLLSRGADPNVSGGRNHSSLFLYTIAYHETDLVQAMLARGADVHVVNDWGNNATPLHVAAALSGDSGAQSVARWGQPLSLAADRRGALEKCRLLLEHDADVNARTQTGATPLLFAAIAGEKEVCALFLKHGARMTLSAACLLRKHDVVAEMLKNNPQLLQQRHPLLRPPLHFAVRSGHLKLVRLLLRHGADVNGRAADLSHNDAGGFSAEQTLFGETPLHVAAQFGQTDIAELLIRRGASVHMRRDDANGRTSADVAAEYHQAETLALLLKHKAKIDTTDPYTQDSISGHLATLKVVLDQNRGRASGTLGQQLLQIAASEKNDDVVNELLRRGAKPDFFTAIRLNRIKDATALLDKTPELIKARETSRQQEDGLTLAIQHGHLQIVKLLVSRSADITAPNRPSPVGPRPNPAAPSFYRLHTAAISGQTEVMKYLVSKGLTLNSRTDDGGTLLHSAVLSGRIEVVRYLLENQLNPNSLNRQRQTPLYNLCSLQLLDELLAPNEEADESEARLAIARLLIQRGANINAADKQGSTPLHEAILNGRIQLAELFLKNGANINTRNQQNATPLREAIRGSLFGHRNREQSVRLLKKHGGTL